jgi:DNA-directed RNA polymerase alpha subunit
MAKFYTEAEIDISPSEYLNKLNVSEIQYLIMLLQEKKLFVKEIKSYKEKLFQECIEKIQENRHRLTLEEEDFIINLSQKF